MGHIGWGRILAAIRIVNGGIALLAPAVLARQMGASSPEQAVRYPFRLFGIRALVNGCELLWPQAQLRWLPEVTVLIHATDVTAAAMAGYRREVSPGFARRTMALSAFNTALAMAALVAARRARPGVRDHRDDVDAGASTPSRE